MAGEFEIISRYFTRAPTRTDIILGVGDDAALLRCLAGHELVVTTDTSIAGRHFPYEMPAVDVGWRALAVNLSDLAAMGATPAWFTLALTLPEADNTWLEAFSRGLFECALEYDIELVGGDTTRGELTITIQAMGHVPSGQGVRRDGARPGDVVCVTGTLGDAALGLELLQGGHKPDSADAAWLLRRLYRPQPRVAAGVVLRGSAHACIDISDGLSADLGHILQASGVGAVVETAKLPTSKAFKRLAGENASTLQSSGDDYELCVCLSQPDYESIRAQRVSDLTAVGRITAEPGLHWLGADGRETSLTPGYDHFYG